MEIILDKHERIRSNTVVALGNFDGLHIGHQALVKEAYNNGKKRGLSSCVFTFKNHTLTQTNNRTEPGLLMNNHKKAILLDELGIDILYMIDFDKDIMRMSPVNFVKEILIDKLNAKIIIVGFNYKFGHKATGDISLLKSIASEFGIEVIIIEPIMKNSTIVSSTYIRNLLVDGKIETANNLLGRCYSITGEIIEGKGRGRILGFPTANLKLEPKYLIPKYGVYKTYTSYNNTLLPSITNIGKNPTFGRNDITVETHILDFNENLYTQEVEIFFTNYLRDEIKFTNEQSLINQIFLDIEKAKTLE